MSKETIESVVKELELLPESEQQLVLKFLAKLRQNRQVTKASPPENRPSLRMKKGLLVFTGQLEQSGNDLVRFLREEREYEESRT